MSEQSRKVVLPAYLVKRLEAFKIVKGDEHSYLLRDKLHGKTYDLEAWQFFILEILPGCESQEKLGVIFEDRFNRKITPEQVHEVFAVVADNGLLGEEAATHPLLAPYTKKTYAVEGGKAVVKSFATVGPVAAATGGGAASSPSSAPTPPAAPAGPLPAGVEDAVGLDPKTVRKLWVLLDPRPILRLLAPALAPLRFAMYLLPFAALAAFIVAVQSVHWLAEDLGALRLGVSLIGHVVFSAFAVNLVATITTAVLAYRFRGTVDAIGISVYMGFLPRFVARVKNTEQMSRRERMWLHAGPLLVRIALFTIGTFLWWGTRDAGGATPAVGLGLAAISTLDLVMASGNPFVKGSAYHLLSAFMNEPHLRGKALTTLMNKLRGTAYKSSDSSLMASYGLAIVTYGFVLVLMVVIMVNTYLQQWQLGGTAVILTALLGLYLLRGNINRVKMINEAYERTLQFERWRNRTLHTDTSSEAELSSEQTRLTFTQKALLLAVLVALFLPYSYQAGGTFTVFPVEREVLTTDVPGIIETVFYDGGETLKKGTPLARLQVVDLNSQIAVLNAQIAEQKAVVQDLKARPKPEEVQVAQQQLEVARSQAKYSRERVPRLQKMYDDHTISFEDLDAAKKQADVDAQQVVEREANLALVKAGVTPDHIAAEEAKLQAFVEQRTEVQKKIDRTVIAMPFDGSLLTLHLKQRVNSYLDKGQPFASVENAGTVTMEIDVPESDAGYVKLGAKVKARPTAFSERTYVGVVKVIDPNVTVKPMGNYIKVIAEMQNPQHDLRTSMTGYAKIEGMTLPVWKAFSLAVIRFFNVQVWSWIP